MITIKYPTFTLLVQGWKSQLEDLVTSHQLIEDTTLQEPILTNNQEIVKGEDAIHQYIEELMQFQEVWFACACK